MALIHCPECRNKISDQASACPKCGYPAKRDAGTNQSDASTVREVLIEKGKIAAIKFYRECKPGLGLAEAKVFVDRVAAELPPGQRKAPGCLGLVLLILVAAAIILGVAYTF